MATDAPDSVRVQCASCGGRFRIRRQPGGALPDQIRCPRCESIIALADEAGPGGWVEAHERRTPGDSRQTESPRNQRASSAGSARQSDRRDDRRNRPDQTGRTSPSRSENRGDSWEFKSAQDARESGSSIFTEDDSDVESGATTVQETDQTSASRPNNPRPGAMPGGDNRERVPEQRQEQPRASESERHQPFDEDFESGPSRIEKLENVDQSDPDSVMTPLPANSIIEDEPDVDDPSRRQRSPDDRPEDRQADKPPSATAIAEGDAQPRHTEADASDDSNLFDDAPAREPEDRTRNFDWEAGEELFVRVDEESEREVSLDELLTLLREGVWVDAVEVRPANATTWVPLRRHPVWDDIREEIVGHSRQIMLEGPGAPDEASREASRDASEDPRRTKDSDAFEQPEPPGPETESEAPDSDEFDVASSDHVEVEPDDDKSDEEVRWYRSAFVALLVVAALLAAALTVLLIWLTSSGQLAASLGLVDEDEPARAVAPSDAGEARTGSHASERPDAGPQKPGTATVPGASELPESAAATRLANRSVQRALDPVNIARGLLEAGRPKAARWHALSVLERGELADHAPSHPSTRQLGRARRVFRDAIREDASLEQSVVTIGEEVEPQKLHALGGGWSISFRFTRHGQSVWAFKPAQKDWEEGWKAEIAAWRFCEVVTCHFKVPKNRPARISRTHFERLYGRVDDREQKAYRERFDALIWRKEKGPSGETRKYLYGTLKEWIPAFAKWPIEYKNTWRPWLSASGNTDLFEQPIDKALKPLRDEISTAWWERIREQLDGASTRDIARQISSLMVFDYVTTNWDRFSNFEEYYGVNNQFANGRFVSIDNGAAFAYNNFGEVMARFSEVQRYSRRTIASLRALSKEVMNPVLFPDPTERGKKRLSRFWAQRSRLLERIADLKEQYGAESVMFFE